MEAVIFAFGLVVLYAIGKWLFSLRKNMRRQLSPTKQVPVRQPSAVANVLARAGVGKRRQSQRAVRLEKPDLELNAENTGILHILENSRHNIFITGKAGTGKSTLLKYFRATTKKNVAVVAPTGVAAINVQGQTIHRFFQFKPDITIDTVKKHLEYGRTIYENLDTLIIDEISMVRADLLDCIEKFLRLHGPQPGVIFGGVQIVAIGDLYQLPPVVRGEEQYIFTDFYETQFFYSAKCLLDPTSHFIPMELKHVFRQKDPVFVDILNAIREGNVSGEQLELLNSRVDENFGYEAEAGEVRIWLVPTKSQVAEINGWHISRLPGEEKIYAGMVEGRFEERDMPTSLQLGLKVGTQVMLLNNNPEGKWVNGDVAKVIALFPEKIRVQFADGSFDDVGPHTWDSVRYTLDNQNGKLAAVSEGSFTQFPVKPAWALTIHKAQGKTYDKVVIDLSHGTFAAGQAYVALSRCRSLEGLILKSPFKKKHIFSDPEIKKFMEVIATMG